MEYSDFIAGESIKRAIDSVIVGKPSSLALIGEKGSGKLYTAQFIASKLLGAKAILEKDSRVIRVNAEETGIEDVREVQRELAYSVPGESEIRRVLIIEHFSLFGHEAQNAMLKTLEEPPLNTAIILTIENESLVLPTILSRVQILQIPPLSYKTTRVRLSQYDDQTLSRAYMMSGGLAGLLISLLKNNEDHELVSAILEAKELLQMPKYKRVAAAENLVKKPTTPVLLLMDGLIRVLEASYRQAVTNSTSLETLKSTHQRLKTAIQTMDDINHGLNQRLALTRLFLAL